jgi:hypothetical protein
MDVPGVLKQLSKALSEHNVLFQVCDNGCETGVSYFCADVLVLGGDLVEKMLEDCVREIREGVRTRILLL